VLTRRTLDSVDLDRIANRAAMRITVADARRDGWKEHAVTDRLQPSMRRLRLLIVAATLLCVAGLTVPALAGRREVDARQLDRFTWGLAGQESGWNYYARNPYSGAFGRYQVMPANWNIWASTYVGRGWVDPSPVNQEKVARGKLSGLYRWLGEWRMVAYWWLTGDTNRDSSHWSAGARRYVGNVMALMNRAPKKASPDPVDVAGETGFQVNPGDRRLLVKKVHLRTSVAQGHHKLGAVHAGGTFQVRKVEWGPKGIALWLKVRTADGSLGWLDARATLPAAPAESGR
jgi:hypothetical protein